MPRSTVREAILETRPVIGFQVGDDLPAHIVGQFGEDRNRTRAVTPQDPVDAGREFEIGDLADRDLAAVGRADAQVADTVEVPPVGLRQADHDAHIIALARQALDLDAVIGMADLFGDLGERDTERLRAGLERDLHFLCR